MSDAIQLKIAIISDLHCYLPDPGIKSTLESFLIVGAKRVPAVRHPVQSLIDLIKREEIKIDTLLCPGDLTNKSCQEGLSQAWSHIQELGREMDCKNIICTLGNHDVDSRKINTKDPFQLPRTIHPDFLFNDKNIDRQYWADGFALIEGMDHNILYLVINTVADHTDEQTASRGAFADFRIDLLEKQLEQYAANSDQQLRIALMHHHPIQHSSLDYSSEDVLSNGDILMDLLSKNKFKLLIHGHRHQPRLRRYVCNRNQMLILASGSFSAMLYGIGSTTRNLFHTVNITKKESTILGSINTWEFHHGLGWNRASEKSARIPFQVNFMDQFRSIDSVVFKDWMETNNYIKVESEVIYSSFPEFRYYLPEEINILKADLEKNHGIKIVFDDCGQIYEMGKISKGS
jgi:predicted phosphodiesterase